MQQQPQHKNFFKNSKTEEWITLDQQKNSPNHDLDFFQLQADFSVYVTCSQKIALCSSANRSNSTFGHRADLLHIAKMIHSALAPVLFVPALHFV